MQQEPGHDRSPVSVVVPAFRAAGTIDAALNSILDSSVNAEIIVVEDGVSDNLQHVLKSRDSVKLVTKPHNGGASAARNTGLEQVTTKYVFFLDADDYVDTELLSNLHEELQVSGADIALGPWRSVTNGRTVGKLHRPRTRCSEEIICDWMRNEVFPPCAVMWRVDSLRRIGGWNESFTYLDDAELSLRALIGGLEPTITDKGCGYYVQHNSDSRLSRLRGQAASDVAEHILVMVSEYSRHIQSKKKIDTALGSFCYEQARRAYRWGVPIPGDSWLRRAREYGVDGHPGSKLHSILCSIFGLPLKERCARLRDFIPLLAHK
jgi:glycosyltransferase involved in cell wall biosynthesis